MSYEENDSGEDAPGYAIPTPLEPDDPVLVCCGSFSWHYRKGTFVPECCYQFIPQGAHL